MVVVRAELDLRRTDARTGGRYGEGGRLSGGKEAGWCFGFELGGRAVGGLDFKGAWRMAYGGEVRLGILDKRKRRR